MGSRRVSGRGRAGLRALLLGAAGLLAAHGCAPAPLVPRAGGKPAESTPPWLRTPLVASASAAPRAQSVETLPATVADPSRPTFDPQRIVPWLDDPRLRSVKQQVDHHRFRAASDALARLLRDTPPTAADEPAWQYQLGRLRRQAGQPGAAAGAFDRASATDWPLTDHARIAAAELLLDLGEPAEALVRLRAVGRGTATDGRLDLLTARVHAALRQVDEAAPIWRAYLARRPRPRGWQPIALRFTRALLAEPSTAHAEAAVRVARQVIYQSAAGRGVGEARELQEQALATIPSKRRTPLVKPDDAELMRRARSLSEAGQGREALALAERLIEHIEPKAESQAPAPSEIGCEAHLARAKALGVLRRYAEASDEAAVASDRCRGHRRQVVALFLGGRYGLRAGQPAAARRRYAELERRFPKHRYADDARLHGAEAALALGDEAVFTRMLSSIDRDYPTGDMVDDALFALALGRITAGDWPGAVRPLERAIARQPALRPYWAEGRPQYFLARARIALGDREAGLALLEEVIAHYPLRYFMVQAYARLARLAPARAGQALAHAIAAEPQGSFVIADSSELHRPAFLRAVALVRQGDGPAALGELESLGVRDGSAPPALLWASAFLLARIEAPAQSHGLLRGATGLWRRHYPAGIWRSVWQIAYPRPFDAIVARELGRSTIPEHLVYAIMREESAFDPRVVSHAGAYGLMQLIVPTARKVARKLGLPASRAALTQPAVNIALGCRYLSGLTHTFDYNPLLAVPGYNAGPGAPARWVRQRPAEDFDVWVERIPYRETRRYTKRVIQAMAAYSMLYGKGMGAALLQLPAQVR